MIIAKELDFQASIYRGLILPTGEILSNEPPLESPKHFQQISLLLSGLQYLWKDRNDYFAAGNTSVYFNPRRIRAKKWRGPDFLVVLNAAEKERSSWVVWDENNQYPNFILEVLSRKTEKKDKVEKKLLYQDTFRTPEYFWFSPKSLEFKGFRLTRGKYKPIKPDDRGLIWSQELGLYLGVHNRFVRYYNSEKELIPTPEEDREILKKRVDLERLARETAEELADLERLAREAAEELADLAQQSADLERSARETAEEIAESERLAREAAERQAESEKLAREKLAAKLRELNIDPDSL